MSHGHAETSDGRSSVARGMTSLWRFRIALAFVVAAMLGGTSPAWAQEGCNAPPGDSSVDQYCERVPSADDRDDAGPGAGGTLERRIAQVERRTGADPPPPAEAAAKSSGADEQAGAVSSGVAGDGWLPWALAALAATMTALFWLRRRRGHARSSP